MAKTMSKNVLAVSVIFIYLTQYYYVTSGMYHKTFYNFNIVLYYVRQVVRGHCSFNFECNIENINISWRGIQKYP